MSSSNCCFLTCIQISQEAGQGVWYSHLLKNFPQFVVIHTVKGFSIINEAEVDVFLEFPCFLNDPAERLLLNHANTPGFLAPGGEEFNPGPETRLDCSELLCNKVLLKYKGDRENF